MLPYTKAEARDWARERMVGVANVITPTFTNDLQSVNEAAMRHDVRREIELGFFGALLVGETATTLDEYIALTEVAADEAAGRLVLIHHAAFNTLEENIKAANRAAAVGSQLVLLAYPPMFFPQSERDLYEYTKAFCENTSIGVLLFPVPLWGFERIHGASLSPALVERLIDECPNIVGIKAEGGYPSIAGFVHLWHRVGDRVVVEMPVESHAIPLMSLIPMQCLATSNAEYYGDRVPAMFDLMRDGKIEAAMDIFWRIHPARQANDKVFLPTVSGTHFAHRLLWKYESWLNGFNGGPLRMPTARVHPDQMRVLRKGLTDAGLPVAPGDDSEFFIGRNPA